MSHMKISLEIFFKYCPTQQIAMAALHPSNSTVPALTKALILLNHFLFHKHMLYLLYCTDTKYVDLEIAHTMKIGKRKLE